MPAKLSTTRNPKTGMTINSKFKPKEAVWYMSGDKPLKSVVRSVSLEIKQDGSVKETILMENLSSRPAEVAAHTKNKLARLIFGI